MNKSTTAQGATAGVDLIAAVRKLVKAKGRYHTEQNYMALVAALDAYDVSELAQPRVTEQASEEARWEYWAEHEARVAYRSEKHGLVFYDAGTKTASRVAWQARAALTQAAPEAPADRMKCDDCDGRGHDGDYQWQGHFQPPEPGVCNSCGGSGWAEPAPAAQQAGAAACPCPNMDLQNGADGTAYCVGKCPTAATTASASGETSWFEGAEDGDGNPLVTIRADDLQAAIEFIASPGMSARRIDGDMVSRESFIARLKDRAPAPSRDAAPMDVNVKLQESLDYVGGPLANDVSFSEVRKFAYHFAAALVQQGAAHASNAGEDTEPLSRAEIGILRFAADALEGLDYEDTAGDLRSIAARAKEKK